MYRNPDGSETVKTSLYPVRFRGPDGAWTDVDLSLVPADGGGFRAAASPTPVTLASDGGVVVESPAGVVRFAAPDVVPAGSAKAEGGWVRLAGDTGVVSEVALTPAGFEQVLVVPTRDGPSSYRLPVSVPAGVSARDSGVGSIELVNGAGVVVGSLGGAVVEDSAPTPAPGGVTLRVVSSDEATVVVEVAVDRAWWNDPARVFPVRIDPSWSGLSNGSNGADTYVTNVYPTTGYSSSVNLYAGTYLNWGDQYRSLLWFNLPSSNANYGVTAASLNLHTTHASTCNRRPLDVYALSGAFSSSTTWNNQPAVDDWGTGSTWWFNWGTTGCAATTESVGVHQIVQRWLDGTSANHGFLLRSRDETWDTGSYKRFNSGDATGNYPTLSVDYQNVPPAPAMTSATPADKAVVSTLQPTLTSPTVTDPENEQVRYWFRVWTGGDKAEHGQVIDSGWQTSTSWQVPVHALTDGASYSWRVYATDASGAHVTSPAFNSFTVNRLAGPSDSFGPVSVKLASGNVAVSAGSLSYNSLEGDPARGLRGEYFTDVNKNRALPSDDALVQSRLDSQVQFNWDGTTPMPNVGLTGSNDQMQVRWTGYVTVPTTDTYYFGATHDDRVKIVVNGQTAYDKWADNQTAYLAGFGSGVSLTAGTAYEITVDYLNDTGRAFVGLWQYRSGNTNPTLLPPDWLTPKASAGRALPNGWTYAGPLAGMSMFSAAVVTNDRVTFTMGGGFKVEFKRPAPDSEEWVPVDDADDSFALTQGPDHSLVLTSPFGVTTFAKDGTLVSQTSNNEVANPQSGQAYVAPTYTYSTFAVGTPAIVFNRVSQVADPVSGDVVSYFYNDGTNCQGGNVPAGMLCKVAMVRSVTDGATTNGSKTLTSSTAKFTQDDVGAEVFGSGIASGATIDSVTSSTSVQLSANGTATASGVTVAVHAGTRFTYDTGNRISRVTAPGKVVSDFSYGTNGKLSEVRDPLANDAVAASTRSNNDKVNWKIDYDGSVGATAVTAPAPVADTDVRPSRSYGYATGLNTISRGGLSPASGFYAKVEWDTTTLRVTKSYDATGRYSQSYYDSDGRAVAVDTPAPGGGTLRSSTVVDNQGRVVDQWGPAPTSHLDTADGTPTSGHGSSDTPNVHTNYDEGINGLTARWWENVDMTGQPKAAETGVGTTGGEIDKTWGSGQPAGITTANNWAGRLSGFITFTSTGDYTLKLDRGGNVAIFVDDQRLSTQAVWDNSSVNPVEVAVPGITSGDRKRITIWYKDTGTVNASLKLSWKVGAGSYSTVPGTSLSAGYGLVTSVVDTAGNKTARSYSSPHTGNMTESKVDPDSGGLQLTTKLDNNGPANRLTKKTLPSSTNAATSYTYWANNDTPSAWSDPCGSAGIKQAGRPKTATFPSPASGSAITKDTVYDKAGRTLGTRTGSDSWTCYTYDARGRATQRTSPAYGGGSARTITYTYAVSNNPLVSSVNETVGTITTTVDLLGRVTQTTDVWNKTRTVSYDTACNCRPYKTVGPEGTIETSAFTDDDQPRTVKYGTNVIAEVTYETISGSSTRGGTPVKYSYPSGAGNAGNGTYSQGFTTAGATTTNLTFDSYGRPTGIGWYQPNGTRITSDYLKVSNIGGQLRDREIDGTDPNPGAANYNYDNAGRLTQAYDGANNTTYAFAASGGCGASTAAGKDTNITSRTVNGNTDTYCYDNSSRITSFTPAGSVATSFNYDSHGNVTTTTQSGSTTQTFTYDVDNRHLTTQTAGQAVISYTRDASDTIVERKDGTTVTARFSGPAVLDASSNYVSASISLPGGVIYNTATTTFSYPNAKGHHSAEANSSGTKVGATNNYDPYGNRVAGQVITNTSTDFNIGWSGIQPTDSDPSLYLERIEMGARQYLPAIGRFLSQDPIDGGSANSQDYALGDPANNTDYSGTCVWFMCPIQYMWGSILFAVGGFHVDCHAGWQGAYCSLTFSRVSTKGLGMILTSGWARTFVIGLMGILPCKGVGATVAAFTRQPWIGAVAGLACGKAWMWLWDRALDAVMPYAVQGWRTNGCLSFEFLFPWNSPVWTQFIGASIRHDSSCKDWG